MRNNDPFILTSSTGQPTGLLVDVWKLWGQKVGREVHFRMGDWPDTLGEMVLAAAQGKALGMSGGDLSVVSTINRLGLTAVFGPPRVKLFEVDLRPGEALMNPAQGSTA